MKTHIPRFLAFALVAGALLALPEAAGAQRRAVRRVAAPRTTVFIGGYYNPFLYDPFYFHPAWFYRPYGYWYPPPFYGGYAYGLTASMRLQVSPRETEVFIDGYYAGTVDDFDGIFQRLRLEPGDHDLVLYLDGYRSYEQRVYLQPGRTFGIRHTMEPLAPGEAQPPRPAGVPPPSGTGSTPPPTAGPAARPGAFGALSLRVQPPDAEVLIDGQRWDGTPEGERLVVELAPGRHTVEIRRDGYRSYITEVNIRSRETLTLNVSMTPQ